MSHAHNLGSVVRNSEMYNVRNQADNLHILPARTLSPLICSRQSMKLLPILLLAFACGQKPGSNAAQRMSRPDEFAQTASFVVAADSVVPPEYDGQGRVVKLNRTDNEWKRLFSEKEYYVLRKEGTERAFTGKYWNNHEKGLYVCAGCGLPLFSSDTKFDSGTGWPSFFKPINEAHIADVEDRSHGMDRTEVECARCGSHQGHVFPDGPPPTGLRYCINSVSLRFVKQ